MRSALSLLILLAACSGTVGAPPADDPATTTATTTSSSTTTTTTTTTTTVPPATWQRLPNLPNPRSEMPVVALDGKIFVPGGYSGPITGGFASESLMEVFDTATGEWSRVSDMPERRHHHMAVALDGHLWVFGGFDDRRATDTAWRYDPSADVWTAAAPMPSGVAAGAAVVFEDRVYVVGGNPDGTRVFRYDPAQDSWEEIASLTEPRNHLAAVVRNGSIYAVGGRWKTVSTATVEMWDPSSGVWTAGPSLGRARGGFAAAAWGADLVVLGGELVDDLETLDSVEVLEPGSSGWRFSDPLPVALHGFGAAVVDDVLYVIGGSRRARDVANAGDAFFRTR